MCLAWLARGPHFLGFFKCWYSWTCLLSRAVMISEQRVRCWQTLAKTVWVAQGWDNGKDICVSCWVLQCCYPLNAELAAFDMPIRFPPWARPRCAWVACEYQVSQSAWLQWCAKTAQTSWAVVTKGFLMKYHTSHLNSFGRESWGCRSTETITGNL